MAFLRASVVLLVSLASYGIDQVSGSACCSVPPDCKNVNTLNMTIQQFINQSPFHLAISSGPTAAQASNLCNTYFPINNSTYLEFATTNIGGTLNVEVSIISALSDCSLIYRTEGLYDASLGNATSVHTTYYLARTACSGCNTIYAGYRTYLLSSCEYINYEYDVVYGLSPSPQSSPACLKQFKDIVNNSKLQVNGFTKASGQPRCVVYYNNATCINADTVNSKFAITYPQDVQSAGC